jgi:glycosyltransferase involved in cell wall biosynthesis
MNILLLAPQPFYQQRGTPIAVKMLAEELAAMGHKIDLLAYREGEDVQITGVTLHRIMRLPLIRNIPPGPSWKKFPCDAAMFFSAWRIMRRKSIDLVHAVEESALIAVALKMLRGVPYVYDMDSSLAEQTVEKWRLPRLGAKVLGAMESLAVRRSLGVVAVCRALEEKARAYAPEKLILRLEDVTLLHKVTSGPVLRDELAIAGPIILYVGNLETYQGIDLLLEAYAAAQAQNKVADLVIIGGTTEHIAHYRRRADALGITATTHFIGPRPIEKLGWYLHQADILVSPRTQGNNTPMKIYSYLDSGRPVIATRLPTHTQALGDDIALMVEPTAEAMAAGILHLLRHPEAGLEMAGRARRRVAEEYSHSAFQRKLRGFYSELQSSPGWLSRTYREEPQLARRR